MMHPSPPWSKRHCSTHRSTSITRTTVETQDGVVTLAGKAKTAAQKDLADKFAGDVQGVNKNVNNMTIV